MGGPSPGSSRGQEGSGQDKDGVQMQSETPGVSLALVVVTWGHPIVPSAIQGVAWPPATPFHATLPGFVWLNQNRRKAGEYGSEPRAGGRGRAEAVQSTGTSAIPPSEGRAIPGSPTPGCSSELAASPSARCCRSAWLAPSLTSSRFLSLWLLS